MEYMSIDTFLESAKYLYPLSDSEKANFKRRMKGNWYMKSEEDFLPHLKDFIKNR